MTGLSRKGRELGFYATVALVFTELFEELAWINVAAGNLIAAGGMGYYFWRQRPVLQRALGGQDRATGGDNVGE